MSVLDRGSLSITYSHTQHLADAPGTGVENWRFEVTARVGETPAAVVAHGGALLVDLFCADPYGALGRFNRHIRRIRDVAFEPRTGELDDSWGTELEMLGDRLLLLDALTVGEPWRDERIEPLVFAMVMTRFQHCAVAALHAARYTDESDVAALRAAGLDFVPARDGVHYLDPATFDLELVLRREVSRPMVA